MAAPETAHIFFFETYLNPVPHQMAVIHTCIYQKHKKKLLSMMITHLALSCGTLSYDCSSSFKLRYPELVSISVRYLTPANLGQMSFRFDSCELAFSGLSATGQGPSMSNLIICLWDQYKAVTLQMFHQHLEVVLFVAFIVFLAHLIVVLGVHKLPLWVGLDMGGCLFSLIA